MKTRVFTTGVLMRRGKLLILKRKPDDDAYPGYWDCVGGHFEPNESAEECMLRETKEETGLDVKIIRPGPLIEYLDRYGRAVAVPFLLESKSGEVALSEHSEARWIRPSAASRYRVVPDLKRALELFDLS